MPRLLYLTPQQNKSLQRQKLLLQRKMNFNLKKSFCVTCLKADFNGKIIVLLAEHGSCCFNSATMIIDSQITSDWLKSTPSQGFCYAASIPHQCKAYVGLHPHTWPGISCSFEALSSYFLMTCCGQVGHHSLEKKKNCSVSLVQRLSVEVLQTTPLYGC